MSIAVTVLLFADLADAAGTRSIELALPAGTTAGAALDRLAASHAAIAERLDVLGLAVGDQWATRQTILQDGDELAFIPPVSGG